MNNRMDETTLDKNESSNGKQWKNTTKNRGISFPFESYLPLPLSTSWLSTAVSSPLHRTLHLTYPFIHITVFDSSILFKILSKQGKTEKGGAHDSKMKVKVCVADRIKLSLLVFLSKHQYKKSVRRNSRH